MDGDFQKALGKNVNIQTTVFNVGPSAIEALLAKRIDVTYVGPNPTINGYVVSDNNENSEDNCGLTLFLLSILILLLSNDIC